MKRNAYVIAVAILFMFIISAAAAYADGMIIPRPLPDMPRPPNLTIKYHRVKVTINNQVATTEVDQVFVNELNRDLEGEYIFPLPDGAALSSFAMEVDGKMVEGKVLEKDEAREIYERIVRQRRDPALLEYVGRNLVRARVYPIPANGNKKITLKYSETLTADNGVVKYVYPLDTERFSPKPLQDCSVVVKIDSKVPIKAVYSPTYKMATHRVKDTQVKASFEKTNFLPEKDLILYYTLSDKDFGLNMMTFKEKGDNEGYFLMFIAPKEETGKADILPKDVVFVLDRSGSMDDEGKMENAKKALKFCLSNLNPEDNFNIVTFSDELDSFKPVGLYPATKDNVESARKFAEGISPMGGTDINAALTKSLKSFKSSKNTPYLIFLTDGLPTVGTTDPEAIKKNVVDNNDGRVRIFTFGVGYDVNTQLLDAISEKNRGYPEYVKPGEEMEMKISSFYRKISEPLLSDVELVIPGVKVTSVYPKEMPDIFKGSQLMVVGQYSGSGPSAIKLLGKRGKIAYNNTYEGTFPQNAPENDFIPRLWAVRRIGYLLDAIKQGKHNKEVEDEIIKLSKRYGIITPYTSFLVTEPEGKVYGGTPHRKIRLYEDNDRDHGMSSDKPYPASPSVSGEEAVKTSQTIQGYKQSNAPVDEVNEKHKDMVKTLHGKSFFLKGDVWVDTEYKGTEKVIKVKFGSEEYFDLIKDKKLAKFLSAGEKVIVKYNDKVYQVE